MRDFVFSILAVAVTAISWGVYGPILHKGQTAMELSRLRPLICVGAAYFVIAVVVPLAFLYLRGEKGDWTPTGTLWSLGAGTAGAVGALGIIMALSYGGKPSWVMPLVFGCAPVFNAFLTIYLAGNWKEVSPMFLAGLILVAAGAVTVLIFCPKPTPHGTPKPAAVESVSSPSPSP